MSEGIPPGSASVNSIFSGLHAASFGVVCVDRTNQDSRWLNFEAGALEGRFGGERVAPYLLDLGKSDLLPPLGNFQAVLADEHGTFALLKTINSTIPAPVRAEVLKNTFDFYWPKLSIELDRIREESPAEETTREVPDMVSEILEIVRELNRTSWAKLVSQSPVYPNPIIYTDAYTAALAAVPQQPGDALDEMPDLYQQVGQILGYERVHQAVKEGTGRARVIIGQGPSSLEQDQLRSLATQRGHTIQFVFPGGGWEALPLQP
jgi:hypothetical protein